MGVLTLDALTLFVNADKITMQPRKQMMLPLSMSMLQRK